LQYRAIHVVFGSGVFGGGTVRALFEYRRGVDGLGPPPRHIRGTQG
jgi:hypothetical protein